MCPSEAKCLLMDCLASAQNSSDFAPWYSWNKCSF